MNYNERLKKSAKVNHWNITYQHVTHINYNVNIETSTAWTRTIQPEGWHNSVSKLTISHFGNWLYWLKVTDCCMIFDPNNDV